MGSSLVNRNSEIKSEGRVWRKCRPVGAFSMACTLVDLDFSKSASQIHSGK
jgi:hypothetical protein